MGTNKRVLKGLTVSRREKVIFYCQLSKMQYLGRKSSRAVLIKIHTTWLSFASLISLVLSSPVLPLVVSMNVVLGLPRFGWRAQWPANLNLLAWIVSLTNVVASVHYGHSQHSGVASIDTFLQLLGHGPRFTSIEKDRPHSCSKQSDLCCSWQLWSRHFSHFVASYPSWNLSDLEVMFSVTDFRYLKFSTGSNASSSFVLSPGSTWWLKNMHFAFGRRLTWADAASTFLSSLCACWNWSLNKAMSSEKFRWVTFSALTQRPCLGLIVIPRLSSWPSIASRYTYSKKKLIINK